MIDPRSLDHLSASSIGLYSDCPRLWSLNYLLGMKIERSSPYAAVGKAVHSVVESFLKGDRDYVKHPDIKAVPRGERAALDSYISSCEDIRERLIAVESEFRIKVSGIDGMPPMYGLIDALSASSDGALLITDHKTNRSYDGVDVWQKKLQPRIYAYAMRRLRPEFSRIRFRIGYVNLATTVEWECLKSDDEALADELKRSWAGIVESYDRVSAESKPFEGKVNSGCAFCGHRRDCDEFQKYFADFSRSATEALLPEDPIDRWSKLKDMQKIVGEMLSEAESEVKKALSSRDAPLEHGGLLWSLETKSTRQAKFWETWRALTKVVDEDDPSVMGVLEQLGDDVFSVRVGGLDALAKAAPELEPIIRNVIRKQLSETSSIKSVKK